MINVLSVFDGMSCGQIALNKCGIKYHNYFASEIDKHAIKVTQDNYPDTIQLGNIRNINLKDLPSIDLMIGGSPCQGFSTSGKRLGFEDWRSKLFFEYVKILKEIKPKYFLLENVKMKKTDQDIMSKYLDTEPIEINSSLVSAQNRKRLYWTNIPNIEAPRNKNIFFKSITEGAREDLGLATRENNIVIPKDSTSEFFVSAQHHSSCGLIFLGALMGKNVKRRIDSNKSSAGTFPQGYRVYSEYGNSPTIRTTGFSDFFEIKNVIRRITKLECERLQTVPDNYTKSVSSAQAMKMLGNGWTVDVITHIFKELLNDKDFC